ncbi:MAG TPA: hypothetical protein VMV49_05625 [Candidatus Deferrimicrobium sp.]|nr:hypothetical protein [Candidatus Deferrimicrobium sp.]
MNTLGEILLGILLGLIGAFINNWGVVLQKRQVNIKAPPEAADKTIGDISQFLKDPVWVLGILMQTIFYLPFLIIAYDLITITLLQPISSAGIIFLVIGLIIFLNEKLRKKSEYLGIGILIFGIFIIAFGMIPVSPTIDTFLSSLMPFWIIFGFILISSLIALVFIFKSKKIQLMLLGFIIGNCYAFVAISMQIFSLGIFDLGHPLGLLLLILGIVGAIAGTVFGIITTQEAFKRGQAINVIPFMQISVNVIPILAGLYVFGQTITIPFFFWAGVIAIIIGASMLARFQ